jgi:hypothetical protein
MPAQREPRVPSTENSESRLQTNYTSERIMHLGELCVAAGGRVGRAACARVKAPGCAGGAPLELVPLRLRTISTMSYGHIRHSSVATSHPAAKRIAGMPLSAHARLLWADAPTVCSCSVPTCTPSIRPGQATTYRGDNRRRNGRRLHQRPRPSPPHGWFSRRW